MIIRLHAIGNRPPRWVQEGFAEYARRMPREARLELVEVPVPRRGGGHARQAASRALLDTVPDSAHVVALDERGQPWSTAALADQLERWLGAGRDVSLLVGGADGLDAQALSRADQRWSLSPLTLPHMLVRVIVAEALYRAASLRAGHPYHRA